jgi:NAD(P)-dependent dehydrogenase (short-subunit alcohol dehydrogenase family)
MDLGLSQKVVLVTGGSNGIGKSIAIKFAGEGAKVAITYFKDVNAAKRLSEEIKEAGGIPYVVQMDLKNEESIKNAISEVVEVFGNISVLVNNALEWRTPEGVSEEDDFSAMVDNNLKGTYLVTKKVIASMKDGGWGRIVFISSDLATDGLPGSSAYTSVKAALHGLSKTLSKELAPDGTFSNVVVPGLTLTDRALKRFNPSFLEEYAQSYPVKRLGTPEDIANVVVFIGSPANSFVNGEVIKVTGGR